MDVLEGTEDVRLTAAKGGKAEGCELGLELAEVVTAEDKVVSEIAGAAQMLGMEGALIAKQRLFELEHFAGEALEGFGDACQPFPRRTWDACSGFCRWPCHGIACRRGSASSSYNSSLTTGAGKLGDCGHC